MQIIVRRGTHQIGGVATELRTNSTRVVVDMGDEIDTAACEEPRSLRIPGVTDGNGHCEAVLFTHYHGDHTGQIRNIRDGIPLYMGALTKDILVMTSREKDRMTDERIAAAHVFSAGKEFSIGDFTITPFAVDHSACDSYMFLLEAEGKKVLHTGDFRSHGFRGKALTKVLNKYIGKVDVLITEGTILSRCGNPPVTEYDLQNAAKTYLHQFKYVFVLCATTNLERISALSKAVPKGRYFICDEYQADLLDLMEKHLGSYSPLYRNIKKTTFGQNKLAEFRQRGFMMMIRDNKRFREIIQQFDPDQSIILYSMWDGYRTKPGSTIPALLALVPTWAPLHTSGHASLETIKQVIERISPKWIIPIHTENPSRIVEVSLMGNVVLLNDDECFEV